MPGRPKPTYASFVRLVLEFVVEMSMGTIHDKANGKPLACQA